MAELYAVFAFPFFRMLSDIFAATVAITSFSVLLFALLYTRRSVLTAALCVILLTLTVIFSSDALGATTDNALSLWNWQKLHWSGLILLPTVYFHFSETLRRIVHLPHNKTRLFLIVFAYFVATTLLWLLWSDRLFSGIREIKDIGVLMLQSELSGLFWVYFGVFVTFTVFNFIVTFRRCHTRTSRRRISLFIVSSSAILIGTFPLLMFGVANAMRHPVQFWILSAFSNLLIVVMTVLLTYAVLSFAVNLPNRVIRVRIVEWVLRGPLAASLTLGAITLLNRTNGVFGLNTIGLNSLMAVLTIICTQFLITWFLPRFERNSISGYGSEDFYLFDGIENIMVFRSEVESFLETLVCGLYELFSPQGVFACSLDMDGKVSQSVSAGISENLAWEEYKKIIEDSQANTAIIEQDKLILCPVVFQDEVSVPILLGMIGVYGSAVEILDDEKRRVLLSAVSRACSIFWQRRYLRITLNAIRTASRQKKNQIYLNGSFSEFFPQIGDTEKTDAELAQVSEWMRDALTHYWGGPRLSDNPLILFKIVQKQIQSGETKNPINALRTMIKTSLERMRPTGERMYTNEWILYNILEMKFIDGYKVREVTRKLSLSEADFYRKQRVAIEALTRCFLQMEDEFNHD